MSVPIEWPPDTPYHLTVPVPPVHPRRERDAEEQDDDGVLPALPGLVCVPVRIERPGAPPVDATLETSPDIARRVPPKAPPLSGHQLAGTACVVCGAWLGLSAEGVGTVRQPIIGREGATFLVVAHAERCPLPSRGLPGRTA